MKRFSLSAPILLFVFALFTGITAFAGPGEDAGGTIKGMVTTSDDVPGASVSVVLKNTKKTALTDEDGTFRLTNIPSGTYQLEISLIGYDTHTEEVRVEEGKITAVNIRLNLSNAELQEVIVKSTKNKMMVRSSATVAKMPLTNLENPQVYNVVTKDLMKEQMVVSFDDALKNAPGVNRLWSSTGRPNDGAGYFSMRGFSVQPTMINGVPGLTNGGIDPANIERIESIKGPSGTLFGSSLISFGGLLNIVTKKPYDFFGGEVSYTGGGFGLSRVTADVNTPLNEDRSALLRVNAAYHSEGSFQDAGFKKSVFLAPSFSFKANDKLSFLINTEFYNAEATNTLMVFLNRGRQLIARTPDELNMDFNRSYTSNDITYKTPTVNLFGQMTYKISDKWTSQTNVARSVRKSDGYYSYVMFLDGSPNGAIAANDTLISRFAYYQNSTSTTTDIQQNFIGDFNIGKFRNRVIAGFDFMQLQSVNDNSAYALFDYVNVTRDQPNNFDARYGMLTRAAVDAKLATTAGATKNSTNNYTYSAYISDVFNVTDRLIAMASLRFDHFDNKPTVNHISMAESGNYSQNSLSPKFGLVYEVIEKQVSLFANYMNGFRNSAPVANNAVAGYPANLKPQQADQKEAGVKLDMFDHKLAFTASYYDLLVTNVSRQITAPSLTDPSQMVNVTIQDGEQESKGVEFDLIANPIPGLNIVAGYSYNHSKILNAAPATKDLRPTSAGPANMANLWISYTTRAGKMKGFGAGFGGNYASDNYITNSLATGTFVLPAYTVVNATLFYNADKYRLALKADNIADKEYFSGWTTVEKQMPRRFSASIGFRF